MTFAHRVAYLGGVCCRRLLLSAVRLPNGCLASANSVFYLAVGISVNPICSVEGLYLVGRLPRCFMLLIYNLNSSY